MNVKEIALSVGKDERSVRRWVKRASDKMSVIAVKMSASSPTHPSNYDLDETLAIIEAGMGKNAAKVWRANADRTFSNVQGQPIQNENVGSDYVQRGMELVFGAIGKLDARMSRIENQIETRAALLPAPPMKPRDHINKLVREYSHAHGISFSDTWSKLYREFGYRTNTNPSLSAKNRGMTIIDYIETEGQIEILESVAVEIFA